MIDINTFASGGPRGDPIPFLFLFLDNGAMMWPKRRNVVSLLLTTKKHFYIVGPYLDNSLLDGTVQSGQSALL